VSKCSVEFDNVSFSYALDNPVIKGMSFKCPGGQTLALVGATGEPPTLPGRANLQALIILHNALLLCFSVFETRQLSGGVKAILSLTLGKITAMGTLRLTCSAA
jgi:hypothetical protein